MNKMEITSDNIIMFYRNKVGYIKDRDAVVDPMFESEELTEFLTKTNNFNLKWKDGIYDVLIKNEPIDAINLKVCRIYQLKPEADIRMKFIGYDELIKHGLGKPDPANYKVVFDGELDTNGLDEIFEKFNVDIPEYYEGHSLSMSDIIELYDGDGSEFHYVDTFGFKKIEFEARDSQLENKQGQDQTFSM